MRDIQGVQEKLCFFLTIHCNPSLAYIAIRDLQSSQRNASVQSLHWLVIFVQPIAAEFWRGRGGKLSRILGKTQYLMNTVYIALYDWKTCPCLSNSGPKVHVLRTSCPKDVTTNWNKRNIYGTILKIMPKKCWKKYMKERCDNLFLTDSLQLVCCRGIVNAFKVF